MICPSLAVAQTNTSKSSTTGNTLKARAEMNYRLGSERSILMTEFWVPLRQNEDSVIFGDLRLMGDNQDNKEGNLGIGYRKMLSSYKGIVGINGWLDRRKTRRGSSFHQVTVGGEYLTRVYDIRLNVYAPLSGKKTYKTGVSSSQAALVGNKVFVQNNISQLIEQPLKGLDLELGFKIPVFGKYTDSVRGYFGGYHFYDDNVNNVSGLRARIAADITKNIQLGTRFQYDKERGSQGFLEATIRFPFGHKQSYREKGLWARMDESPERDIDIVTASKKIDNGGSPTLVPVINKATGEAQNIIYVDNEAGAGGNGTIEQPYNVLTDAQTTSGAHDVIYIKTGDGGTTNQDQGLTLDKEGVQLIGAGSALAFDPKRQSVSTPLPSNIFIEAGTSPQITNINANGDGIRILNDNIKISGVNILNTNRDGIAIEADGGAASAQNIEIENVSISGNNRHGLYIHAGNNGAASARIENVSTTGNSQHGITVYDDTTATFDVDLGGGVFNSTGNNILAGNTLEDLAVEYDGRTLAAQNNWWGQVSGPDQDNPDIGIRPQIYYGAPINNGLTGHYTFDNEWMSNTIAYDRSPNDIDGVLRNGLSLADQVSAENRQGLNFVPNSYITLNPNSFYLPANRTPISIWSKFNASTIDSGAVDNRIVTLRRSASSSSVTLSLGSNDNVTYFSQTTGARLLDDSSITTGTSNTGALSYNGTSIIGYVNGVADSDIRNSALNAGHTGSAALIGSFNTSNSFFKGVIDEVRIYDRPLSAAEVSELQRMNTSSSVNASGFLTAAP